MDKILKLKPIGFKSISDFLKDRINKIHQLFKIRNAPDSYVKNFPV